MTRKYSAIYTTFLFILCFFSCTEKPETSDLETLFTELSPKATGIGFINQLSETEKSNIIEYLYYYNGGGVAVGDINNDGLPDIYFSSNQLPNKLYLNKGGFKFEDITEQAGLASQGQWKTGISMVDINGDGFLDIYVCRVGNFKGIEGRNELYINNRDLTFSESAAEYGLDFQGFSTHAAFFDYDGDGDLDMYLLNHAVHTENSYGRASLRYIDGGLSGDRLYRNNSEKGEKKFSPVTNEAGIFSSHIGYGLGVGIADFNNDGWPDIYVSNDFNENDYLYINQGNGTFKEQINEAISYSSRFSMGNDLADFNNDGWVDIISVDMLPEDEVTQKLSAGDDPYEIYQLKLNFGYGKQLARNMLQLNNGNGAFSEIGQLSGVHATDWSWAPLFADFDNDGHKDLFISNGILRRPNDMDYINFITHGNEKKGNNREITNLELASKMPPGETANYIFKNRGDLTFENVSKKWGFQHANISNGTVYADLDNDGDLDLIINHINQPAGIFRNNLIENAGNGEMAYLKIRFEGNYPNRFGIGAKVIAFAGKLQVYQENFTSRGFQSSVAPEIHLGLGNTPQLDSLLVIWPGGKSQTIRSLKTNQAISVKERDAKDIFNYSPSKTPALLIPIKAGGQGLDFEHIENNYNDFNLEPLLPHKISKEGPAFATGDINGDGLQDIFVGGAENQPATIFIQKPQGKFEKSLATVIEADSIYEDVSAVFFDSNNNGHLDLYVVSAGNTPKQQAGTSQDRLYINDGKGNFVRKKTPMLPNNQGAIVLAHDFDQDGLTDIFVGGRVCAGKYGEIPRSYLLKNLGDGNFRDVTKEIAPEISYAGMVKDGIWADVNQDGWIDLILVGEWMPVSVYINEKGKLINKTVAYNLQHLTGWWNAIKAEDITGNGFPDLVVGNLGLNSRLKASDENPVKMFLKDFYQNESLDQIITQSIGGKSYTIATKDELTKNIPSLKKPFLKNRDFSGKTVEEIFKNYELDKAVQFQATEFQSILLLNNEGKNFKKKHLPLLAQSSPIHAILLKDINGDGCLDLLVGGNQTDVSPYFGPYQGSRGLVMYGDCKGDFQPVPAISSGINSTGDIRHIASIAAGHETYIIIVKNDAPLELYKINGNNFRLPQAKALE